MDRQYYICPICGCLSSSTDRFVICKYCDNDDVVLLTDKMFDDAHAYLKSLPRVEFEKYLCNPLPGRPEKDWLEISVATEEYFQRKYVFSNPDFDKIKYNNRDRQEKEAFANRIERNKRDVAAYYGHPTITCPTCGSTNTKKISGLSKAASVGLFGIFSQKVKHQFHCNSCGYEW